MGSVSRVLVVGGGLSGTAAALSLRRVGIDVELIERETVWRAMLAGNTNM
jgi:2-polyprenyl-6-methoxyphenol hydroxylase-like FAD-dependent oxidoreductase